MRLLGIVVLLALLAALWWLGVERLGRSVPREVPPTPASAVEELAAVHGEASVLPVERAPAPAQDERTALSVEDGAEPGLALAALVEDCATGRPLEGARLTVLEGAVPLSRVTDGNGMAVLRVRDSRQPVTLRVEAAGHAHQQTEVSRHYPIEACLSPTVTLAGRVLAADTHEPLANARLSLAHVDCDHCAPDEVVAGADGRYELPGVPLFVEVELVIQVAGCEPDVHGFELRTGEPRLEQDLFFVRGREIAGRVEDWVSAAPLAGASVAGLTTDATGGFRGRVLPEPGVPGRTLRVSAPGYAELAADCTLGGAEELVFRLPRYAAIEGTLSDVAGRPIEGGSVSATIPQEEEGAVGSPLSELPEGWGFPDPDDLARSDARGHYRIEKVLPWGKRVEVYAHARGFEGETVILAELAGPGSLQRADLVLRPATESILGGTVTLNGAQNGLRGSVTWRSTGGSGQAFFHDGLYELHVVPGAVELTFALADVPGPLEGTRAVVEVEAGCRAAYSARLVAPTRRLDGRVRFEEGGPVARARVMAMLPLPPDQIRAQLAWRTATDLEGRFQLDVPEIGALLDLQVDARQQVLVRRGVAPGTTGLEFVLGAKQALFVRAFDAESRVPLGLYSHVRIYGRASGMVGFEPLVFEEAAPDASGWFEAWVDGEELDLLALPLAGALPGYAAEVRSSLRPASEPVRVEFALRRGLELAIELDSEIGPWPEDVPLALLPEELWEEGSFRKGPARGELAQLSRRYAVRFDEQGQATLGGLAPGRHRFRMATRELVLVPDTILVDGRFGSPVRVQLKPAR